ncbi:MAG: histidine phosphatase family protein [Deltaproteobacteria bacterium]|nr:histidine phosphatase family protein [Deltaproteobacteria bacterium]
MQSDEVYTLPAALRAAAGAALRKDACDVPRTRLYLVRHGALVTSPEWRYVGHRDIALSDEGRAQIRALADRLKEVPIDAAYCSDLGRTVESAQLLIGTRGLAPVACPEFREIDIGHWEGMTLAEILERFPAEFSERTRCIASFRVAGGESFADVRERALPRLQELLREHAGKTVLLVAHGGLNRVILCDALGLDLNSVVRLEQAYACLNIIDYFEDYPVVQLVNETPCGR